jgi:hypothetical protein
MSDLSEIQKQSQKIADEKSCLYQVNKAVMLFDKMTLQKQPVNNTSFISKYYFELFELQSEIVKSKLRNPSVDFSLEIAIYPINNKKFLGVYFTEQSDYLEILQEFKWYSEYGYWNNTDQPDNISDKEWTKRKKDWGFLPHFKPFNENMLTFKCVDIQHVKYADESVEIMDFETRLKIVALIELENQFKNDENFRTKYREKYYQKQESDIKLNLEKQLVKNLTFDMLCGKDVG